MVKVAMAPTGSNTGGGAVEHGDAETIKIFEGHLYAERDNDGYTETVAIYAPGQWVSAIVEK